MRNKISKALPVFLVSILLGIMLVACSSKTPQAADSNGTQTPASATTDQTSTAPAATGQAYTGKKTDINIWLWDVSDSRRAFYAEFTKLNPQYNIVLTSVLAKDMTQKLQTALASGADLPDIAWLEATYRGKLLSLDMWEDISKPPYNLDKSKVLDYLLPLETTTSGTYVGPEAPSVGGMAYKRALAKQYFGTDDPAEMQKIFTDWDTFIKKGIEVKQKSNGKVFMFASLGDAYAFLNGQSTTPFIQGNTLNFNKGVSPILEKLIEMKKAGIVDTLDINAPAEGTSYTDNTHIFYPCANWSVKFTIEANDKNGMGRWGFMTPPGGPFPYGGTVQGVPQKAKNKEGAAKLINFFFMTQQGSEIARDQKGNFSPFKPVYDIPNFYSAKDPFFADQDVMKAFETDIFPKIKSVRLPSKYDQDINDSLNVAMQTINASSDGNIDIKLLIKKMQNDLTSKLPDIKAE